MSRENPFPLIITSLPKADMPFAGLDAYLLQGKNQQVLFMTFEQAVEVPEHSHEAQWGVVLDGEIELAIAGETKIFTRGDSYYIPKGVPHSAKVKPGYRDVTLFNLRDRYKVKVR